MKKALLLSLIFLFCNIITSLSQAPLCLELYQKYDFQGLTFKAEAIIQSPPLSIYMPENTIRAYIYIDSVYKNRGESGINLNSFLKRQTTYNDSLKIMIKNYIWANDYDPIRFYLYMSEFRESKFGPITYNYEEKIKEVSTDPFFDKLMLYSNIIAHIKVDSITYRYTGSNSYSYIITSTIIDTILGKTMPTCKNIAVTDTAHYFDPIPRTKSILHGECMQFCYIPYLNNRNIILDKNLEYIVFLRCGSICYGGIDTNLIFYNLVPSDYGSSQFCLYPIVDGKVIDSNNEVGIGTNVELNQYKTELRKKLNYFINFNPTTSVTEKQTVNELSNNITLFPNPVEDKLSFNIFIANEQDNLEINIYSLEGTNVISQIQSLNKGKQTIKTDCSNLSKGMYIVKLKFNNNVYYNKFIKM